MFLPKNVYQISKDRDDANSTKRTGIFILIGGIGIYLWYQFDSFALGVCVALGLVVAMLVFGKLLFKTTNVEKIEAEETAKLNQAISAQDKEAFANSLVSLAKTIYNLKPSQKSTAESLTMELLRDTENTTILQPNVLELSFLLCVGWDQYKYDLNANPEFYNSAFYTFLKSQIQAKFINYAQGSECVFCGSKDMNGSSPMHVYAQKTEKFGRTKFRGDLTVSSTFQHLDTTLPVCQACNDDRNKWWLYIHHSDLFMTYLYCREEIFGVTFDSEGNRQKIISPVKSEDLKVYLPDLLFVPEEHLAAFNQSNEVNLIERMGKSNMVRRFMGGSVENSRISKPLSYLGWLLYGANFITYPSFVALLEHLGIASKAPGISEPVLNGPH